MKAAVWLALAASPALSQAGGGPVAPFAVYTQFDHEPPGLVLNSLRQELTSIMSNAGWQVEWRSLAKHPEAEAFAQLAVVTFRGSCDVSTVVAERVETGALGWTHVMDGQVLPYSEINCELIRAFLSRSMLEMWPQDRDFIFGRAVARVLAHELYHVFTRTRHHGSSGVAEASFTVRELIADDFAFSDDDQRALLALLPASQAITNPAAGQSVYMRNGCTACHGAKGEGSARGPSLRKTGNPLNVHGVAFKLVSKASEMYRRARDLKKPLPHLAKGDIESLLAYLSTPTE